MTKVYVWAFSCEVLTEAEDESEALEAARSALANGEHEYEYIELIEEYDKEE